MSGWFKIHRSEALDWLLEHDHGAFILLTVIARRARYSGGLSLDGLDSGQAKIGDYERYGLTRQQYRTAKSNLQKYGIATFQSTNKGTIATLVDTSVYEVCDVAANQQPNQQPTSQPTIEQPAANQQPTTNKKVKKEKKEQSNIGDGSPPPDTDGLIAHAVSKYPDQETIAQVLEAFASTRTSHKISPMILLDQLRRWEKYDPQLVVDVGQVYLEKDCAGQGKGERYFMGMLRNEQKRRDRMPKDARTGATLTRPQTFEDVAWDGRILDWFVKNSSSLKAQGRQKAKAALINASIEITGEQLPAAYLELLMERAGVGEDGNFF